MERRKETMTQREEARTRREETMTRRRIGTGLQRVCRVWMCPGGWWGRACGQDAVMISKTRADSLSNRARPGSHVIYTFPRNVKEHRDPLRESRNGPHRRSHPGAILISP